MVIRNYGTLHHNAVSQARKPQHEGFTTCMLLKFSSTAVLKYLD